MQLDTTEPIPPPELKPTARKASPTAPRISHTAASAKPVATNEEDNKDTDSEAAPLMLPHRQSYLKILRHTPPREQPTSQLDDYSEPPHKRTYASKQQHKQSNNEFKECTQCHTQHKVQL